MNSFLNEFELHKRDEARCHPERKRHAKGLCQSCYDANRNAIPAARERKAARDAAWYAIPANREKAAAAKAAWYAISGNRERAAANQVAWKVLNPEYHVAYNALPARREKKAASTAAWRAIPVNRERRRVADIARHSLPANREKSAARQVARRKIDIRFRLAGALRSRLRSAIRNRQKSGSAVADLGCSIQHLKLHIELLWATGMSWNNYGRGPSHWSVDHVKPLVLFDLADRAQCLEACHFINLQPLWHKHNVSKKDCYPWYPTDAVKEVCS